MWGHNQSATEVRYRCPSYLHNAGQTGKVLFSGIMHTESVDWSLVPPCIHQNNHWLQRKFQKQDWSYGYHHLRLQGYKWFNSTSQYLVECMVGNCVEITKLIPGKFDQFGGKLWIFQYKKYTIVENATTFLGNILISNPDWVKSSFLTVHWPWLCEQWVTFAYPLDRTLFKFGKILKFARINLHGLVCFQ